MARVPFLASLKRDQRGTAVIETAFVLPILCMLSFGAFEASLLVARNSEMRSALSESVAIILAHAPQDQAQIDTIEDIIETSTGLAEEEVTVTRRFRCGIDSLLIAEEDDCPTSQAVSRYLEITLADTYTPRWTSFGIGEPVNFTLTRTVQIG